MDNFFVPCIPIWRPLPECEDYEISTTGQVASTKNGAWRLMAQNTDKGYKRFSVTKVSKGIAGRRRVHRAVAETFIPNPDNLSEVNHKNGKKWDNRVENLEWASHQKNMEHAGQWNLLRSGTSTPSNKLTEDQVREIRAKVQLGDRSMRSISREYKVSLPTILGIIKGTKWRKLE